MQHLFSFISFFALLLCSHLTTAVRFTYPAAEDTTIDLSKPITITWETNATDPAIGRILLVKTSESPPTSTVTVVANRVELADGSYTTRREFILSVESGENYHFEFEQPDADGTLAKSNEFTIEGGRDEAGTSSDVVVSTITVPSTSATSSPTTSVSTGSQTSMGSSQSQTPTPTPSQGSSTGSSIGEKAGIRVGVSVGALISAALAFFLY